MFLHVGLVSTRNIIVYMQYKVPLRLSLSFYNIQMPPYSNKE